VGAAACCAPLMCVLCSCAVLCELCSCAVKTVVKVKTAVRSAQCAVHALCAVLPRALAGRPHMIYTHPTTVAVWQKCGAEKCIDIHMLYSLTRTQG